MLKPFAHGFDDFGRVGECARFLFGVNFFLVHRHFENSATGRNQRERTDLLLELQKFIRQTDGLRFVVSERAIFNGNLHSHMGKKLLAGASSSRGSVDASRKVGADRIGSRGPNFDHSGRDRTTNIRGPTVSKPVNYENIPAT